MFNPMEIIDSVALGATKAGKIVNQDLFKIVNRAEAIKKAISLAKTEDIVLITGKGAEQFICGPNGKMIAHDDRGVARKTLK